MGSENGQPLGRVERWEPNIGQRIEGHFQGKILAGLMQLVPILATVFVLAFIIGHTDGFIRPMPFVKDKPWDFPGVGLIAIIVIFYLVGLFASQHDWSADHEHEGHSPEQDPRGQDHIRGCGTGHHPADFRLSFQPGGVPGVAARRHGGNRFRDRASLFPKW